MILLPGRRSQIAVNPTAGAVIVIAALAVLEIYVPAARRARSCST